MTKKHKVINFSALRSMYDFEAKNGFIPLEGSDIRDFYAQKHSHSIDIYDFRFVDWTGRCSPLFFGMFEGDNSNIDPQTASLKAGMELNQELNRFELSAPALAEKSNKCVLKPVSDGIILIAVSCERGTIIGGWYNSQSDQDIALQMLAYCIYCFAAVNYVHKDGARDRILKEKVVDTVPEDSRFGKFSKKAAETDYLVALAKRMGGYHRSFRRHSPPS